ncbi:hypothetical protein MLD38_039172 [Melastoma candidum]|uniref:Uncharacterized protein n=1 Tax=Melastoma candidum TaxID=119954 RepID=A0ACB9L2S6_9MYRT|nr:hypothetical protein MLD38_039172 [Melastoma candidum]
MLLDVERAGVEAKPPAEQLVLLGWEGPGHELTHGEDGDLHEDGGDGEGLSAEGEEGVEEDEEDTGDHPEDPHSEGHYGEGGVVGLGDDHGDLLNGAPIGWFIVHGVLLVSFRRLGMFVGSHGRWFCRQETRATARDRDSKRFSEGKAAVLVAFFI